MPGNPVAAVLLLLTLSTLPACSRVNRADEIASTSRQIINADEIERSQAKNAYDAIARLRGDFLSYRGQTSVNNTSSPYPAVYLDDQLLGEIHELRHLPANQIAQIRMYRAWEATSKFGMGNISGVIAVYTKH